LPQQPKSASLLWGSRFSGILRLSSRARPTCASLSGCRFPPRRLQAGLVRPDSLRKACRHGPQTRATIRMPRILAAPGRQAD